MDIEIILDAAEARAPGLRELARRFLKAETRHPGRAARCSQRDGTPIRGRARSAHHRGGRLLEHLAATEPDPLNDGRAYMALARTGAQAIVTRIETQAASQHVC